MFQSFLCLYALTKEILQWELLSEQCGPHPLAVIPTTRPSSYQLTWGLKAVLGEEIEDPAGKQANNNTGRDRTQPGPAIPQPFHIAPVLGKPHFLCVPFKMHLPL